MSLLSAGAMLSVRLLTALPKKPKIADFWLEETFLLIVNGDKDGRF